MLRLMYFVLFQGSHGSNKVGIVSFSSERYPRTGDQCTYVACAQSQVVLIGESAASCGLHFLSVKYVVQLPI